MRFSKSLRREILLAAEAISKRVASVFVKLNEYCNATQIIPIVRFLKGCVTILEMHWRATNECCTT